MLVVDVRSRRRRINIDVQPHGRHRVPVPVIQLDREKVRWRELAGVVAERCGRLKRATDRRAAAARSAAAWLVRVHVIEVADELNAALGLDGDRRPRIGRPECQRRLRVAGRSLWGLIGICLGSGGSHKRDRRRRDRARRRHQRHRE